ncbi:MAG: response regulator [Prevotella sp.]|nr:response regulator [Prevotella sp.]
MMDVRHSLCRLLAAVIVILLSFTSYASEGRQKLRIGTSAGMIQFDKISLPYEANLVERIYKDSQGMMWFATRRGLFLYDGYSIRRLYEGNYYAIVAVDDDVLCIGGEDGLRWLNLRTEKFVMPFDDVPATKEVRSLVCHGGKLFVGTKSQGLFCLDLKKRTWQHYDLPDGQNEIIFSFESTDECLYIAHHNGLSYIDAHGRIHDGGINDNVYAVWYDKSRNYLWIGTEHRLLCRNQTTGRTTTVSSGSTFNQIIPSPSGDILLASEFGLKILNPVSGTIQTIGHDVSSPKRGLPSNTIHQIFCDEDGIWIATDRGIAITHYGNIFETIPLPSITHSNDGNIISRMLVDSKGDWWMGGDNGILHIRGNSTKWFKVGSGLKKSVVRCIYEDCDKDIWIATDAGIARYNPQHDEFDYYVLTDQKGRTANWTYDIFEDAVGRLWIATFMGGLYVVDKKVLLSSGGAFTMKDTPFGSQDEVVNTIYRFIPDGKGVLWANTSQGLASINTRTMEVKLRQKMLIDNMIFANGIIWLDVKGHLYRYDTQKDIKEETAFYIKDGMIQAFVYERLQVGERSSGMAGRLWMSTSEGLFYVNTEDGSIHPYNKPDYGFTAGVYMPQNNLILWGGEDVICKQDLHDQPVAMSPSKVFISSVMIDGQLPEDYVPRFESIIRLTGREDIVLDLATFEYNRKNVEVFWYKIGRNGEWHSLPNGSNKIMISHLSGGEYRLFLTTDADHTDTSVTEYVLKVPYPWYFRWWAWMLYLLAIVGCVWAILNRYKQHEKKQFEQRERERVMAMTQQKMDFFVDMSHELKTPLSLIIAPISKLLSETSNAKLRGSLKTIQNNAMRLNDLIHRILDFKQLEVEGENQILASRIDLCNLITECIDEFAESAKERKVKISLKTPEAPILMDVDVVKIQVVMRNILSNALKYVANETGEITICVEIASLLVVVSISDNGPGVSTNDIPKLFNRYYMGQNSREGSGIGLSVVKKYIELHGGEVCAVNNHGLTIKFTLPVNVTATNLHEEKRHDSTEKPIVLIVDDNHEMLEFLTTTLEPSYQCITALNGEVAMKTIETTIPDIVITDQMMPGIDGTELCYRLRHHHATKLVPIIMLTAKDDANTELKSIRSGADVFMPKPFDLRKLQLHIVQLLNKRKAIAQSSRIDSLRTVPEETGVLTNDEELMERVVSLINSNMHSEEFNVAKLCDLLCMDQKQLYRKLKQLTGETPVNFIRKQRMSRAAVLLKQDRFTISEVMFQVGYNSASYFTKSFTKEFGVSPKEYR